MRTPQERQENPLRYEEPRPLTREEAVEILESGDARALCEAIISLSLTEPDWRWVEREALRLTRHDDPDVRSVAATALGHLVRIHGRMDSGEVMSALNRLLSDPQTAGRAEDALSDIQIYLKRD
jgi:hypothetical protein